MTSASSISIGSYVAIGDSFTEGLGDEWPDGSPRGWADRLAQGLNTDRRNTGERPLRYANLAIRGRKLGPILDEQLDAAITLAPDLISINGGGNDMLRPGFGLEGSDSLLHEAVEKVRRANIRVLLLAGPDPSKHLPLGQVFHSRGSQFVDYSSNWAQSMGGLWYCDNFNDERITAPEYWSEDGLHLGPAGHMQVAINCLSVLGVPVPPDWRAEDLLQIPAHDYRGATYYKKFIVPWVKRRLKGQSSGDGRSAKRPQLEPLEF